MDCWSSWVPTVDRFLCWSLRTGALVIGGLNLVELLSVSWSKTGLSQVLALGMLVYYGDLLVSGLADSFENREQEDWLETGNLKLSCFQH